MKIHGIIPALHTAYDGSGALDPGRQALLVERLISQGVHGFFVGGSTGEFPLLSLDEREKLSESVIEAAGGRAAVLIHVGSPSTADSVRLSRHALRAGANAISCLPPFYYHLRWKDILAHFRAVAEAAEPLPFYGYHIPERTGVPLERDLVSGLLEIPNFAGLKWSDRDMDYLEMVVRTFGDRADLLSGIDELLFPALTRGARGAVGSTFNFLAPWFVSLWDSFHGGKPADAERWQAKANWIIARVNAEEDPISSGKVATRWAGVDCGEPRPPLRRYSPAEISAFESLFESSGIPRGGLGPVPPGSAG